MMRILNALCSCVCVHVQVHVCVVQLCVCVYMHCIQDVVHISKIASMHKQSILLIVHSIM